MSLSIGAVSAPVAPLPATSQPASAPAEEGLGKKLGNAIHLNPYIEHYFLKLRQDPRNLPVSLAVEDVILHQGDLDSLHRAARDAATTQLRQELGREPRRPEVLVRAYNGAAAAVIYRPYKLPGIEKLNHYFVSAALTARAYKKLSYVPMPEALRERSAYAMAMSAGYLKEVLDMPTTGFGRHDLVIDREGAASPFQY